MYFKSNLFRFLKWFSLFKLRIEVHIVPMKIYFPRLLVNFYNEDLPRSIAGNVGKIFKLDLATL